MSAVRSVSLLWLASLGAAALALGTQVLLARTVAPADFGLYAASVAVATVLTPLAALGVPGLLPKLFGAEGAGAVRWLRVLVAATLPALMLGMVACASYAFFSRDTAAERIVGLALAPMVLSYAGAELAMARYQIERRSALQSLWTVVPNLARFCVALGAWMLQWSITQVALAIGAVSLLTGLLSLVLMAGPTWRLAPAAAGPVVSGQSAVASWRHAMSSSLPFGLSLFVFGVYSQGIVLLAEALGGAPLAGNYSLMLSILAAVYLAPSVLSQRFLLSRFHVWAVHDPARLLQVFRACCGALLALGGVAGIGIALLGPFAVQQAFGSRYADVGVLLVMCSLCVPARFVSAVLGTVLSTKDNIYHRLRAQVLVAAFALIFGAWAIDQWGLVGAALVAVGSEWLLFAAYLHACWRYALGPGALTGWTLNMRSL